VSVVFFFYSSQCRPSICRPAQPYHFSGFPSESFLRNTVQASRGQPVTTLPFLDSVGNPSLTGDLVILSPYLQTDQGASRFPTQRKLEKGNGNTHLEVLRPGNGESLNDSSVWPEQVLLGEFPVIDGGRQHQPSMGGNAQGEGSLPQGYVDDNSNESGSPHHPSMGSSSLSMWSPQQALATPTAQNFVGFHNPAMMLSQPSIQNPAMMRPQMVQQPPALPHVNSPTPSLYPPHPLSTPFLPAPIPSPRTPCPLCTESFARPSDLNRHWQSVHLGIKYHCDYWLGCPNNGGKGYCRLEKLRTHQREKHGFAWS
jgi:hypothetical protein